MPVAITSGWRSVQTEHGDTLARIAARELQDASRWPELAWLNDLLPPYLTASADHPSVKAGRAIAYGGNIKVPTADQRKPGVTPAESFGIDARLTNGALTVQNGDIVLVSGHDNLRQALEHRLRNDTGCLPFHPKYGNAAHRLRGYKADPNAHLLALRYCEECLLGDPRVLKAQDGTATLVGDAIRVAITAVVDDGSPLRLQVEI